MVPLLEQQYEMNMRAECFLECWYTNQEDKSTVYKTDTGDIKQYVISPNFLQDNMMTLIVKNIPNTPLPIHNNLKEDESAPTTDMIHTTIVYDIFERNIWITF